MMAKAKNSTMVIQFHWSRVKNISSYYLCYFMAFITIVAGIYVGARLSTTIKPFQSVEYNTYKCNLSSESGSGTFRVYANGEEQAVQIADSLCNDVIIKQRFAVVEASWLRRDLNFSRVIFEKQYHLLSTKPELMAHYETNLENRYVSIASYADNNSKYISLDSQPELSLEYFNGKILGMLDNPDSVSGYKVPKMSLQKADIREENLNIRLYETHVDLYWALVNEEVDLIATGIQLPVDPEITLKHFILPIDLVPGPHWYLHPDLLDTELHCHIGLMFKEIAVDPSLHYESSLKVNRPCE